MSKKKKGKETGKRGGVVKYSNKYGDITQQPGGADAITYATLPSMNVNRQNGTEFGFGSHYSKLWRDSIAKYKYLLKPELQSELSKLFKETMQEDKLHIAGQRSLDIRLYGERFNNYSLGIGNYSALVLLVTPLDISEDRKFIQLNIPGFKPLDFLNFPEATNCFRLFMTASVINKYEYDQDLKAYVPEKVDEFVLTLTKNTTKYYSSEEVPEQILEIEFDFIPDPEHLLIVCIGAEFSILYSDREDTNGKWCGMKVLKVA